MTNDQHPIEDFFGLKQEETNGEAKKPLLPARKPRFDWDQVRLLPKVLSVRERYLILALLLVMAGSIIALPFSTIAHFTRPVPAYGGTLTEGTIGQPHHVNPL